MSTSPNTTTVPWEEVKDRRQRRDGRQRRSRGLRSVRLTDRDLELLRFAAAHRFVEAGHVRHLVRADRSVSYRLLSRLTGVGLLRYERIFYGRPGIYTITNGGLAVVESPLPRPAIDLRLYRHEQLVPNLWLAAHDGTFGPAQRILTERQLRHQTQTDPDDSEPLGAKLGGFDRAGRARVHHPDVVVIHPNQTLTAIELELTLKGRKRLHEIVLTYALDSRFARVRYLVDQRLVHAALTAATDQFESSSRIHVHRLPEFSPQNIRTAVEGEGH